MAIVSTFATGSAAAVDPATIQSIIARVHQLDEQTVGRASRWTIDPGTKACLLRDGDDKATNRILFVRETGKISMWLTPRGADIPAKVAGAQLYQVYFVPLGEDVSRTVVNEFGASLWQEPLVKTGLPGIAIEADPGQLIEKFPAGFAVVLAQGDRALFADIIRPDVVLLLPELKKCRGGR